MGQSLGDSEGINSRIEVKEMSDKSSGKSMEIKFPEDEIRHVDIKNRSLEELIQMSRNMRINPEHVLLGVAKKKRRDALIRSIIAHTENTQKTKEVEFEKESSMIGIWNHWNAAFALNLMLIQLLLAVRHTTFVRYVYLPGLKNS